MKVKKRLKQSCVEIKNLRRENKDHGKKHKPPVLAEIMNGVLTKIHKNICFLVLSGFIQLDLKQDRSECAKPLSRQNQLKVLFYDMLCHHNNNLSRNKIAT